MADKPRSQAERVEGILDGLAEHIESAPGEELLEDARREGFDVAQVASQLRGMLQQTVKAHQQRELQKAKEAYNREVTAIKNRPVQLPTRPQTRRRWLEAVFAQQPQLQVAFTMQNRDFSALTDADVESHLRKLEILGVLKDVNLPTDND